MEDPRRSAGACDVARCVALAAALLIVGGTLLGDKGKAPTEAEKAIVEDSAKGLVGAVYLEKLGRSQNQMFQVSVRAKILSTSGFDIGTVERLAWNAQSIEGRTISPAGKVTELSSKDIRRVTTVKAGGRSIEQQTFTLPALEPGCFIEYSYKEWGWLGSAGDYHTEILFQGKYPILHQEVRTPKDFPFSSSVRLQKGVEIRFRKDGGEYVYEASNAAGLHDEPHGLPEKERAAAVIFAWVFHDVHSDTPEGFWKEAAKKGFAPHVRGMLVRPAKVEDRLKSIPGSRAADPKARLQAIYRYVQKTVKNRWTLRPGETEPKGGWKKNQDAGDTLANGEGSPSDLAAVCASLLRADGWRLRYVFTPDREERFFHPEIPSLFQFYGWVLEVQDPAFPEPVFLGFDHPLLPFGQLPWNRLGVAAFAFDLDSETGEKIDVPQRPSPSNSRRRDWRVTLADDGDVEVERATRMDGLEAFRVRTDLYRQGRESFEKDLREHYEKLDPPGELESLTLQNEETPDVELLQTTKFRRKGIASALPGGRLELAPLSMLQEANPFTQERRDEPIMFAYPYLDEDTLTITPPAGYATEALPTPIDEKNMVGRYSVRASKGVDGTLTINRVFEVKRFSAGPELYAQYRSLFAAASRGDSGFSLVLRRSAATKSGR
jgi:hypothetical protein